jgi:hypothetical protein
MKGPPEHLIEILRSILGFELELREFFALELSNEYGDKWTAKVEEASPESLRRVVGQIRAVRKQFALHDRPLSQKDLMDYLSFGQYIDLLKHDEIFSKCIGTKLGSRESAIEGLAIIAATRNEIAHGRTALANELAEPCRFYLARLRRQLLYTPQEKAEIEVALGLAAKPTPMPPAH